MSGRDRGVFWYKDSLALRSPLTPQEVCEQLSKAQPFFDVDTGRPVPVVGFAMFGPIFRGTLFSMRVRDESFRVAGPLYLGEPFLTVGFGLSVTGSVEPAEQGSLIHLTAANGGVGGAFFIGLIWIALCISIFIGAGLGTTGFFAAVGITGVLFGLLAFLLCRLWSGRSQMALNRLVPCLQKMLRAQRTYPSAFAVVEQAPTGLLQPHRAKLVLVLGILSLLLCPPLGIVAWVMGRNDLAAMRSGSMDSSGEILTQIGLILGIMETVSFGLVCLWFAAAFFQGVR